MDPIAKLHYQIAVAEADKNKIFKLVNKQSKFGVTLPARIFSPKTMTASIYQDLPEFPPGIIFGKCN